MIEIKYIYGDATQPVGEDKKFIIHCCNSIGAWGAGFVIALSKRWKEPEKQYKQWYNSKQDFELGKVQYVKVEPDIVVVNMIGQKGIGSHGGVSPIRYEAIEECLEKVAKAAIFNKASVHAPKFGAGLAGGNWTKIEEIIIAKLCSQDINVTVYNYERLG